MAYDSNYDINKINTSGAGQTSTPAKKQNEMGQQEFLMLLVNQLQNQDPMNPLEANEFAAQLATYAQLEQLLGISSKLDTMIKSNNPVNTMATFLGREVVQHNSGFVVANGRASHVLLDLPEGSQSLRVEILADDGSVIAGKEITEFRPGKNFVGFDDVELGLPDGNYAVRATVVDEYGRFVTLPTKFTETVQGFVLEPVAALVVNGRQITIDQVREVY